ncbi:AfsR/SARP family transcriptional regulator [Streptomyces alboniger]|uniref:AfsR/SARP family transcriptional regulator n=1 Tax=Streptomyces alboniger TaxID=132473 RepID=A0A5J6HQ64_STRAD|nr:AfsR/SARP family transcriptional regulator [Streptomyces alboniger]
MWDGEGEPVRVPETKVRALLADLLVHEGRPVSADRLVEDLWGDEQPGRPANALQSKVSQLRRAIGRDRVVYQAAGYWLRLDMAAGDVVDAFHFRDLVGGARLEEDPRVRAELLDEALQLWRGPAYADFADEEFVRASAQRLAEQRLAVWEERGEARLASGDLTLLTGELADLVARYPLRERLRGLQMRALYLAGRQGEALASYRELRGRLDWELGVEPGPALAALHAAILRQDPGLAPGIPSSTAPRRASPTPSPTHTPVSPRPSPPRRSQDPAPAQGPGQQFTNLPAPLTPLLGREEAVRGVRRLLEGARVVTLTGAGGVGKTRLAVEAAARTAGEGGWDGGVSDGVWLVEFAGLRGGSRVDELAEAVAGALGLRDDAPSGVPGTGSCAGPLERLAAALRDRHALLVLDNCEQVVEQAAHLVGTLLRAAPRLRVLATSQEPLGLTGEAVFLVEPLDAADAVTLFAARAAASAPGFSLADPGDAAAVAEICRRLDGLPLALELAATRVRGLGVRELAARLHDRFRLLTSGQRGAPARQRTLRAVLDWSWELLTPPERTVLRRLAVHRDGCTLEAAEAVCAGDGVAREDVLDLVTRLVDRSLVVLVPGRPGAAAGAGARYRLLESVGAYAVERLAEREDLEGVRERHLRYYLALAEQAEPCLRRSGQREWLARLDAEAGNLRAALEEAVRAASAEARGGASVGPSAGLAVRMGVALAWWWLLCGRLAEARRSLSEVVGLGVGGRELRVLWAAFALLTGERGGACGCVGSCGCDVAERAVPRAPGGAGLTPRSLWLYAYALFSGGELERSEDVNACALALAERRGEVWGVAGALSLRAMHALIRGDLATIRRDGLRGAALFEELGDRWGALQTVSPLAVLAEIKGDYEEAARRQDEGLRIARELGLEAEVAARLSGLGRLALLTRDGKRAAELHEQARTLAARHGYRYGEIHAEMGLALGARRSGDLDAAESHLLRIRDRHADVSSPAGDHLLHAELGFVAELRGDGARAEAEHLLGLEIARRLAEPRALALSLEGLAGAALLPDIAGPADTAGPTERAAHCALLLGAADAARRSVGAPLPPAERGDVDRITAAAKAAIGETAFADAFARGATLPPGELPRPTLRAPSPPASARAPG